MAEKRDEQVSGGASALYAVFGANLRALAATQPSVAEAARLCNINRVQFSRYLKGEGVPRAEVLERICRVFDVDARILLTPLAEIVDPVPGFATHPYLQPSELSAMFAAQSSPIPVGNYRVVHRSFWWPDMLKVNVFHVFQRDGFTFVRGFYPLRKDSEDLHRSCRDREARGVITSQNGTAVVFLGNLISVPVEIMTLTRSTIGPHSVWLGGAMSTESAQQGRVAHVKVMLEPIRPGFASLRKAVAERGYYPPSYLRGHERAHLSGDFPILRGRGAFS